MKRLPLVTNDQIIEDARKLSTIELSELVSALERELFTLSVGRIETEIEIQRKRQIKHRLSLLKPILRDRQNRMKGF
jgi:ribosomal protein L29